MYNRIFALIIIIFFLVIPGYLFWYYIYTNRSSLIFIAPDNQEFHVSLSGKFGFSYFPLFDRVFLYKSMCRGSCVLSPIVPIHYDGEISASGMIAQQISLDISPGQEHRVIVDLIPELSLYSVGILPSDDTNLINTLIDDFRNTYSRDIFPLGQSREGDILAFERIEGDRSIVGKIGKDGFIPDFSIAFAILSGSLDKSKSSYIFTTRNYETFLVSLDGKKIIPYNLPENPVMVLFSGTPIVSTYSGSYSFENGIWRENPRFTYFIDIDNTFRIGYIDKNDIQRRSLSNITDETSLFFLIDRSTGKVNQIDTGKDIDGFTFYNGQPGYIARDGTIFVFSSLEKLTKPR